MKNSQGVLTFLILLISLLFLANTISPYYNEMRFILFALAGLAGLGVIFKLFGGSKWSDEAYAKHGKKTEDYNKAVAKLTAKQKKRKKRKKRRK